MDLFGNYFSTNLSGATAGDDILELLEAEIGNSNMIVKKLALITVADIGLDVNTRGVYSHLWKDADLNYKLALDANDVLIGSMIVEDTVADDIFVAVIY